MQISNIIMPACTFVQKGMNKQNVQIAFAGEEDKFELSSNNQPSDSEETRQEIIDNIKKEVIKILSELHNIDEVSQEPEDSPKIPLPDIKKNRELLNEAIEAFPDEPFAEEYAEEDDEKDDYNCDIESYENLAKMERGNQRRSYLLAAYELYSDKIKHAKGEEKVRLLLKRADKCTKYGGYERKSLQRNKWFERAYTDLVRVYHSSTDEQKIDVILMIINACLYFEQKINNDDYKENWRERLNETFDLYVSMFKGQEKEFALSDKIDQCKRIFAESDEKEKWADRIYESCIELSDCVDSPSKSIDILSKRLLFSTRFAKEETKDIAIKEKWQERAYNCYSRLMEKMPLKEQLDLTEQFHILCCSYIEEATTEEQKEVWQQRRDNCQSKIRSLLSKLKS